MNKKNDEIILSDLEKGYNLIADKFSSTRAFMWRDLGFLKNMVKPGDSVLDFGCGNGRLAGFIENNYQKFIGVDISQKLVDLAKQRYHSEKTEFIKIDPNLNKLPFKDNSFDIVFSIAVFHHFPSKKYTLEIAKELCRVLKPGGKIIITVWNLWQKQFLRFGLKNLKRSNLGKKSGWGGFYIPFKSGEKTFQRYHHPFRAGELEELFQEAGFRKLKTKTGYNLLYIGEK